MHIPKLVRESILPLTVVLLAIGIYGKVRSHEFILLDDGLYIFENLHVLGGLSVEGVIYAFANTDSANWHPLTWLVHMVHAEVAEGDAGAHLLFNLSWHAFAGVLLYAFGRTLKLSRWVSGMIALIWVAHPGNVENVAWASELKSLVAMVFSLATMIAYVRWTRSRAGSTRAISVVLFAGALLAKPVAVTIPIVLLLVDLWPLGRIELSFNHAQSGLWHQCKILIEKWPFITLSSLFCGVTIWAQSSRNAVHSMEMSDLAQRMKIVVFSYLEYLELFFAPSQHSLYYPIDWRSVDAKYYLAVVLLGGVTILAILSVKRCTWVCCGWLWFVFTTLPMAGIIPVGGQAWAERYLYFPAVGLAMLSVVSVDAAFTRLFAATRLSVVARGLLFLFPGVLAMHGWVQVAQWKNNYMICLQSVEVTGSERMLEQIALGCVRSSEPQTARSWLARLPVSKDPETHSHRLSLLAATYALEGNFDAALHLERQAAVVYPSAGKSWHNVGIWLARRREYLEAYLTLRKAWRLLPQSEATHEMLMMCIERLRRPEHTQERVSLRHLIANQ